MKTTAGKRGQVIPFIQNGDYFFKRGVLAYQKEQLKRAVKYLERAIDLKPDQGVFHCQLAAVLADAGEYERSNEILHYVIDHVDDTMYDSYFFLANNYAYQGLFDKARESATAYLALQPHGDFVDDAKDLLELLRMEHGEEEDSEEEHADELIVNYERACRHMKNRRYNEAQQLFENIIVDYPSFWSAHSQLSQVLHMQGRTEEALVFTKELLEEVQYFPAVCQLAIFYFDMGRKEEAKAVADQLRTIFPMDRNHIYRLASMFCHLGYDEEACRYFRHYLHRFTPDHEDFYFQYGVASYRMGDEKQAEKMWKTAVQSGHQGARKLLDKWEDGLLSMGDVRCDLYMDPSLSF